MVELADDVVPSDGALRARRRRDHCCQHQGASQEAREDGNMAVWVRSSHCRAHHRYPASPTACWQRALTPGAVVRQGIDLEVSLVEPAHNLTISRAQELATAARAAIRFW